MDGPRRTVLEQDAINKIEECPFLKMQQRDQDDLERMGQVKLYDEKLFVWRDSEDETLYWAKKDVFESISDLEYVLK